MISWKLVGTWKKLVLQAWGALGDVHRLEAYATRQHRLEAYATRQHRLEAYATCRHRLEAYATRVCAIVLLLMSGAPLWGQEPAKVVQRAHAHNDYLHERPLLDALEHGFNSVEADIFLVEGKLLVAHSQLELRSERTLQALYLDPLKERIAANGGRVFRDGPTFGLLIDLKSDAESTYRALHEVLIQYASILSSVQDGQLSPGAVSITISGNRPQQTISGQKVRYCGIDGRLSDLDSQWPAHLLPMISDNWNNHFKWRGKGEMPAAELTKLKDIVARAHAQGRVVRFWATPEEQALWQVLVDTDVDLINTDRLAELESFLK